MNVSMSKCPECERMRAVMEISQQIGNFMDWGLQHGHIRIKKSMTIERILAKYFDVDLEKVEAEKQQILAELRKAQGEEQVKP